ncbi:DNA mismatch repair protein MSH3 [Scheffersomyces coipomensis]|uniref:DNA mismatch repair protein MSH3 n=1 Tax=Scheffersomyces coipomensis TaxID=1788519 RepID=UPI00315CC695
MNAYRQKQFAISHFFQSSKNKSNGSDIDESRHHEKQPSVKGTNPTLAKFSYKKSASANPVKYEVPAVKKSIPFKRKADVIDQSSNRIKKRSLTPLEKQVRQFKDHNKDKLLLFQVGYKFKSFGQDAEIISKILNIMYIRGGDNNENDEEFSYCSFPDNRLHINLKRILEHGHKVGVVKQSESAIVKSVEKTNKSDLMTRELTGTYTKGTYMDDELIYNSNSNSGNIITEQDNVSYIICINEISNDEFALVAVQPLTGEIIYDQFKDILTREQLETRLVYLNPIEVIVINDRENISIETNRTLKIINQDIRITHNQAKADVEIIVELNDYFNDSDHKDLIEFYTLTFPASIQNCFIELIQYLVEFKLDSIFTIPTNIKTFTNAHKYMILPSNTIQTLQLFKNENSTESVLGGSLLWLLDHTRTKFGSRLLKQWISKPLIERNKIEERSQAIEDLKGQFIHVIDTLKNELDKVGKTLDLEQLLIKIHYSCSNGVNKINRRELVLMLNSFNDILKIMDQFSKSIEDVNKSYKSPLLLKIINALQEMSKTNTVDNLLKLINPTYLMNESKDASEQKTQFFNSYYIPWKEIEQESMEIKKIESLLNEELVKIQKLLKRPQLQYLTKNNESYLIEVRNGKQVDALPNDFIKINGTATVSRFRSPEVIKLLKLLEYHQELYLNRCDEAFREFLLLINKEYIFFNKIVKNLSTFDCLLSLTTGSLLNSNYIKPKLVDDQIIEVKNGRNPIIENLPHITNFVPNDINIHYNKDRVLIITGPNMGGKSLYVNQVALLVIMTQIGCYLPCKYAKMGIFDSIFIRMGAYDNILKNNSTFKVEMLECSTIINKLTSKSLIILDEIGRGTSTSDGIAIAYSILDYIVECKEKPLVLFITHFPSLHVFETTYPNQVKNYHMGFKEIKDSKNEFPQIVFLYNLVEGVVNNSYGLNVAKLAGLATDIISNAYKISEQLKNKIEIENMEKFSIQFIRILQQLQNEDKGEQLKILSQLESLFNYL